MVIDFTSRIQLYKDANSKGSIQLVQGIADLIFHTLQSGKTVFAAGNGGSASEASHLIGELVGRFVPGERKALRAICLNSDMTALTAIGNDFGFNKIFSRQIEGLSNPGDPLICLSTSGSSPNIIELNRKGKSIGLKTVLLTGENYGPMTPEFDLVYKVESQSTALIQELHLAVIHIVCSILEEYYGCESKYSTDLPKVSHLNNLIKFSHNGRKIVWVNGCFDLLHIGHLSFLQDAAKLGDELWVGLNSDKSIKRLKGLGRPIQNEEIRAKTLAVLPWVDKVIIFDEEDPSEAIKRVRPSIVAKGSEYMESDIPEKRLAVREKFEIQFIQKFEGISTSEIISRIQES